MDTAAYYLTKSQSSRIAFPRNRAAVTSAIALFSTYATWGGATASIGGPAGRLLNNYTHWHGGTLTNLDISWARGGYLVEAKGRAPEVPLWTRKLQTATPQLFSEKIISASCLYALKNVSYHSNSVYAWNRPNVCMYRATNYNLSGVLQVKYPAFLHDISGYDAIYNVSTAHQFSGYGDAPFLVGETAGIVKFKPAKPFQDGSSVKSPIEGFEREVEFVSASIQPFYDSYESFATDIRTKNKDMSVIPEFRISQHVKSLSDTNQALETPMLDMFEIPGAFNTETGYDQSPLTSESTSGSFFKIYSNSDFLEHFEVLNEDHKDLMEPTTLTLQCTAIKKFMPYKGFYPAERTVQLFDQFMQSYMPTLTASYPALANDGISDLAPGKPSFGGTRGDQPYTAFQARPVTTPLFAPGILFNSIKSGLGVDFPIITGEGNMLGEKKGSEKSVKIKPSAPGSTATLTNGFGPLFSIFTSPGINVNDPLPPTLP